MVSPQKLYRYSERKWLERSLEFGEFRLRPATDYKQQEIDFARHDDELVRTNTSPASSVKITICETGQEIKPSSDVVYRSEVGTNYFTVCFSKIWDERLFEDFSDTDSCLVIHDAEQFRERFHSAVEIVLPEWAGIDAAVVYGGQSQFGAIFSKPPKFIGQHEWRFAWHPPKSIAHLTPITVKTGSIADIAEIVDRPVRSLQRP